MRTATREVVYRHHSRLNAPALTVVPGERFLVETELCSGRWLTSLSDVYRPELGTGPNPTVVVAVEGALAGQCVAVHIHDLAPDNIGYTAISPGRTPFPDWIRRREWGVVTKTVAIRDGLIHWSDSLKLPTDPMIGTLGTAPAEEVFSNAWPGRWGGNMDVQEVRAGANLYLPVYVPGALLHIGDVHAIMGDGEINCGGGIECRALATLSVDLLPKPARMEWPRIVDATHITAVGCARPAEDAFRIAVEQLVYWMVDQYGYGETDAFMLLSQVMEARATQLVDPLYTYVAKIRRAYLPDRDPMG
jgi:amidase